MQLNMPNNERKQYVDIIREAIRSKLRGTSMFNENRTKKIQQLIRDLPVPNRVKLVLSRNGRKPGWVQNEGPNRTYKRILGPGEWFVKTHRTNIKPVMNKTLIAENV